ncbi:CONSERVED IN THE GREEN LINEAGE AND DIATOMS 27, chloroplastic-like protein [Drosera capensis]
MHQHQRKFPILPSRTNALIHGNHHHLSAPSSTAASSSHPTFPRPPTRAPPHPARSHTTSNQSTSTQALSTSFPFSWAAGSLAQFTTRLAITGLGFGLLVGLPVSWAGAVGSVPDPGRLVLGSVSGGLFMMTLAVVMMYLGGLMWGIDYSVPLLNMMRRGGTMAGLQNHRSQIWVKTAEVLARDWLLGLFQVKPVLNRLKNTLVVLALSLVACVALLMDLERRQEDSNTLSNEAGCRAVAGVYNAESARLFEPDAFCGKSDVP